MTLARAAAVLLAVLLLAGCGGGGSGGGFSVVRADGTKVAFEEGFAVFCGPWEDDVPEPALHVESPPRSSLDENRPPEARLLVSAVLRDLSRSHTVRFPHSFVFSKPTQAIVFVYDGKTKNEAASDQEEASGTLVVRSFSCEDREVELEFDDVVLGSELSDGGLVTVSGRLRIGG